MLKEKIERACSRSVPACALVKHPHKSGAQRTRFFINPVSVLLTVVTTLFSTTFSRCRIIRFLHCHALAESPSLQLAEPGFIEHIGRVPF